MSVYEKLFDHFPPVSTRDWIEKAKADLKGADFNKKLVWRTAEGFDVQPFYRAEHLDNLKYIESVPGEYPFIRSSGKNDNTWLIRQDIKVENFSEANKKALDILNKGVDSVGFIFNKDEFFNLEKIASLLNNIYLEGIEINFRFLGNAAELLEAFKGAIESKGIDPATIRGAMETDPLSRLMINGTLCKTVEEGMDYLADLTRQAESLPGFRVIQVNASNFPNAGATIVQELAFGMAMYNEYLAAFTERGIDIDHAASVTGLSFGVGSNYFMEIAKLRAARLLWAIIVKGYRIKLPRSKLNIHCITSEWNKTIFDPYVNMLRTQTESMSASLGGTDSLTVIPFDSVFDEPDDFSERIARSQQLLLKEESHFDKVVDPAGGSYYIENLTASVAEHAWELFIEIENMGGFTKALEKGFIQESVNMVAANRCSQIASGKEKLLGTNIFPNKNEVLSFKKTIAKEHSDKDDLMVKPLELFRGAEAFEELRISTEKSGQRPVVFLLTIGNPSMRKARAQFSSEFFSCAGYEVIDNNGFKTVKEGVDAALSCTPDIIVICSSDDEYSEIAPDILKLVEGKAIVVIAGAPSSEEKLRKAGIEYFINIRSNILDTLRTFNKILGID